MPIGGRNPTDPPVPQVYGAASPAAAGVLQGTPPAAVAGTRWLRRIITPTIQNVTAPGISAPAPVAVLPAPGPGANYVIERLTVIIAATTYLYVYAGDSPVSQNVVDAIAPASPGVYTMADGASSIRLGPADQLYVAWGGISSTSIIYANVQARIESA